MNANMKEKKKQIIRQIYISPLVMSAIGEALSDYTLSMNDAVKRKAKDKFMDQYQKAEFAYKELLKEYKLWYIQRIELRQIKG